MPDQGQETTANNPEPEVEKPVAIRPEKDHFLQNLVDSINLFPENSIGVTLQMHGLLVSGRIIAGDKYYDLVAEALSAHEEVKSKIKSGGDVYREDRERGSTPTERETTFIHLQGCTFHNTGGKVIKSEVLWRGRIAEVQGFFFGVLETVTN